MDYRDLWPVDTALPIALTGVVSKTAADFTRLVPVTIPSFDQNLEWGPCRWQARDDVTLPQKGDACLVIFTADEREPWIAAWWPF